MTYSVSELHLEKEKIVLGTFVSRPSYGTKSLAYHLLRALIQYFALTRLFSLITSFLYLVSWVIKDLTLVVVVMMWWF